MQAQFTALASISEGVSVISEQVFESRGGHIVDLRKMGADIDISGDNRVFTIRGVERLHGANVAAADLRAGAALIVAGLAAAGETIVSNAKHILRGYEDIARDLGQLGADIRLVAPPA
ncbi:MAG: hypothetical protein FWB71_05865 [Defluviitaleaceae bacterium]|nr:hypothetical protein [Defluviitaleaceae bacterium]